MPRTLGPRPCGWPATCGWKNLPPPLSSSRTRVVRRSACGWPRGEALLTPEPPAALAPLTALLADANQPVPLRQRAAELLGRVDRDDARQQLFGQLRSLRADRGHDRRRGGRQSGCGRQAARRSRAGRASATLLREPTVLDRLQPRTSSGSTSKSPSSRPSFRRPTTGLPS